MKYMVMECHLSYAVVLDEDGRFLTVANRNYQVGQTVTEVLVLQTAAPKPDRGKHKKMLYSLAAMAACLVLVLTSLLQTGQLHYASVYLRINPEVRIDVNRRDAVVGLEGINEDGNILIEDYVYRKKALDLVTDELILRAIEMGYLHEGGAVSLVLDASSDVWVMEHSDSLSAHLSQSPETPLNVTFEVSDRDGRTEPVVIPAAPGTGDYRDSDYGDSDYGVMPSPPPVSPEPAPSHSGGSPYEDGQSDYGDSLYEEAASDYGDSLYEETPAEDGDSLYEEAASDYGDSLYGETPAEDGDSPYEEAASDYGDSLYEETPAEDSNSLYEEAASDYGDSIYVETPAEDSDSLYEEAASDYGDSLYEEAASDYGDSLYEEAASDYGEEDASDYGE